MITSNEDTKELSCSVLRLQSALVILINLPSSLMTKVFFCVYLTVLYCYAIKQNRMVSSDWIQEIN